MVPDDLSPRILPSRTPPVEKDPSAETPGARKACVLAVDDEPINLQLLYRALRDEHEMLMASGGAEALELCERERPDLILLDVVMPDMDGLEVCRRLKADQQLRDIPVIFITGHSSPAEETDGLNAGAVDFISKPVNPAVVRARVRTQLTLKAQADQLRQLVFVDGLTGVANRRRFDEMLDLHWRACARSGTPLSLFLIDVDFFKQYNDLYGHQAGDECLRKVARTLQSVMRRSGDLVARYGGEEFVCLSTSLAGEAVAGTGETLCDNVERLAIPHEGSSVSSHVTISVGAASEVPTDMGSAADMLALVDARLYQAKKKGRNALVSR